jgi:hypothetical protein
VGGKAGVAYGGGFVFTCSTILNDLHLVSLGRAESAGGRKSDGKRK